jgi:diacylglycerol kinase
MPGVEWRGNFWKAFYRAGSGLARTVTTQRNMKIHLLATAAVLALAGLLELSREEWLFLLLAIFLVLVAEALNTAVETVVDLVSPGPNPLAGRAKDIAAGAVLLAALHAVVAGALIFGPHLQRLWGH